MSRATFFTTVLLSGLLAAGIPAPSAVAGPIADAGAKADTLMDEGKTVEAIDALDAAMEEIWRRSPLVLRKVLLVNESHGFGIYQPRDSDIFHPGEKLRVYVEPVGYAYGKNAIGGLEIAFDTDLTIRSDRGKQLFYRPDLFRVALPVRYHNREFNLSLTLTLTGLPPGKYVGAFHLKDRHSDKAADFELPFEIAD
jgi:hypothetical protein